MIISIITLFPEMFEKAFNLSIIKRAQEEKTLTLNYINLRDFGIGTHKTVDDKPYGGGVGMVLRVDVLDAAIESAKKLHDKTKERVILLDPRGQKYSQKKAEALSSLEHIILVCGHYEGVDARILPSIDEEISIGDYVLSGGEIPAMVVADSVIRLVPGVLRKEEATQLESFTNLDGVRALEHSQYTRPPEYKGMTVPEILLSGNHKEIEEYRAQDAHSHTKTRRPELLISRGKKTS